MDQLRVIEIAIKPPFNFFVMIQGQTNIYFETKSLLKAKQVGEELLLKESKYSFIHSVYYSDDENRQGWFSKRILEIEDDYSWSKCFDNDFIIHPAFLYNYDVRKWNLKLYDKLNNAWLNKEDRLLLKDNYDWESVKKILEIGDIESKSNSGKTYDFYYFNPEDADRQITINEKNQRIVVKKYGDNEWHSPTYDYCEVEK